jgi:NAD(P)-dependent dehydrogenase (short-subunit alcohol dehydrogenase family)
MEDIGRDRATPVALVTGASRGIGKAIARHLADAGFDVAIGARTLTEGQSREHSPTVKKSDTTPLPGSLEQTAREIEARGRRALPVYLDLLDRTSLGSAVTTVLERWGRVDVLVNNARYIGPGHMDLFVDTPIELLDRALQGNVIAPLILIRQVLPGMIERGQGFIINIASGSGQGDPQALPGKGGWGLSYGMSKAAEHRIAGVLNVELKDAGILAFNLSPGQVATERLAQEGFMKEYGFNADRSVSPDVIGAVAAWLVTSPDAVALAGTYIEGQELCRERQLLEEMVTGTAAWEAVSR